MCLEARTKRLAWEIAPEQSAIRKQRSCSGLSVTWSQLARIATAIGLQLEEATLGTPA
jgi:hypothetical protein